MTEPRSCSLWQPPCLIETHHTLQQHYERENQAMARIKAKKNFAKSKVPDLLSRGHADLGGGFNKDNTNSTITLPPINTNTIKNALDDLSAKHANSLNESKQVKEELKSAQD